MSLQPFKDRHRTLYSSLVLTVAVSAWLATLSASGNDEPPSPVTLAEVRREVLNEQLSLSGTSVPWRRVMLSPRVEGLVTEVHVDEGSWVESGDPVLALDSRLASIDMRTVESRVEEAHARHRDAIRIRDELLRLKKGRHASETSVESAIAEVEIRAAALSREQAELERSRELLERHSVLAPFAGMVVGKHTEVGQWVQRDDAVVELVSVDTVRVRAPLPQRHFARVEAGSPAIVGFDALPQRKLSGTVVAKVALGSESSRSFPLLIDLPNPDHLLAPGMSARVLVEVGDLSETLTVPRDAVIAKTDGSRLLWRIREDDGVLKAHPVRVETGRAQGDRLELLSGGLKAGDRVVLLGNENLRPGQRVLPQQDAPTVAAD